MGSPPGNLSDIDGNTAACRQANGRMPEPPNPYVTDMTVACPTAAARRRRLPAIARREHRAVLRPDRHFDDIASHGADRRLDCAQFDAVEIEHVFLLGAEKG